MLGVFAGVMLQAAVLSAEASLPFFSGEVRPDPAHAGWYQEDGLRYVGPSHREALTRYLALADQVSREKSAELAFARIYGFLMTLEQPARGTPSYLGITLDWMQRHPDLYGPLLFRRNEQLATVISHPTQYIGVLSKALPAVEAGSLAEGNVEKSWAQVGFAMEGVLRTCLACHR